MEGISRAGACLVYRDRAGRRCVFPLTPPRAQVVVGRHPSCDLVSPDSSVSRRHCTVVRDREGYGLIDLGSQNGTLVNDHLIDRVPLRDGDVIQCAGFFMTFHAGPEPDAELDVGASEQGHHAEGLGQSTPALGADDAERLQSFNLAQGRRLALLQDELSRLELRCAEEAARAETAERLAAGLESEVGTLNEHLARQAATLSRLLEAEGPDAESGSTSGGSIDAGMGPDLALATSTGEGDGLRLAAALGDAVSLRARVGELAAALAATRAQVASAALRSDDHAELSTVERARLRDALQRLEEVDARESSLSARLAEAEADVVRLTRASDQANAALSDARAAARDAGRLRRSLRDAESRIAELESQVATLEELMRERGALAERLANVEAQAVAGGTDQAEALRERVESLERALAEAEGRAHSAEAGLAREAASSSADGGPEPDPATARRLEAMSVQLGAVTRRAQMMQVHARELRARDARIAELEAQLEATQEERDSAAQHTLALIAEKRVVADRARVEAGERSVAGAAGLLVLADRLRAALGSGSGSDEAAGRGAVDSTGPIRTTVEEAAAELDAIAASLGWGGPRPAQSAESLQSAESAKSGPG